MLTFYQQWPLNEVHSSWSWVHTIATKRVKRQLPASVKGLILIYTSPITTVYMLTRVVDGLMWFSTFEDYSSNYNEMDETTYCLDISFLSVGWQSSPYAESVWNKKLQCVTTAISFSSRDNNLIIRGRKQDVWERKKGSNLLLFIMKLIIFQII